MGVYISTAPLVDDFVYFAHAPAAVSLAAREVRDEYAICARARCRVLFECIKIFALMLACA